MELLHYCDYTEIKTLYYPAHLFMVMLFSYGCTIIIASLLHRSLAQKWFKEHHKEFMVFSWPPGFPDLICEMFWIITT